VISGFRHEVDENCAPLGYYAASSGNLLPTFRNNQSIPSPGVKNSPLKLGPTECPETSVWNRHYSLHNNPEKRSSQVKVMVNHLSLTLYILVCLTSSLTFLFSFNLRTFFLIRGRVDTGKLIELHGNTAKIPEMIKKLQQRRQHN
jgi:hypothetical protein